MSGNSFSKIRISFEEVSDGSFLNISGSGAHMISDICNDAFPSNLVQNFPEKVSALSKITIWMVRSVAHDESSHTVWLIPGIFVEFKGVLTIN